MYLKNTRFPKKEYIMCIASFLKGKALNFYMQKGELYKTQWDLKTFYSQLFDFCFPPNYQMNLHDRLDKTIQQSDHSVIQYAYNILEIFGMLGNITAKDQVLKLWKGFKLEIQEGLWRDKLNPDHDTWNKILDQAVGIEMLLKAINAKEYRKSSTVSNDNSSGKNTGSNGNSNSSGSNKKENFKNFKHNSSIASVVPSENLNTRQCAGSSKPAFVKGNKNESSLNHHGQNKTKSLSKSNQGDHHSKQGKAVDTSKVDHSNLTCFSCGKVGHIKWNCHNMVKYAGNKPLAHHLLT